MNLFTLSFLTAFAEMLTTSLLHFVWQGAVLTLMLLVVVKLLGVRSARHRYLLSVATLFLMGMAPVLTALLQHPIDPLRRAIPAAVSPPSTPELEQHPDVSATNSSDRADPVVRAAPTIAVSTSHAGIEIYVLIAWLMGVSVLSMRLAIGYGIGLWIRAKVQPLSAEFEERIRLLGERLGVDVQRRVFACARVGQAVAVGFLRPVVLIPTSWLTQLSPQMIEAIIAHELAHIRRWDLWVNLAQRIVETLLFYHPGVWWLSERIRLEREICCDEIAADCFDRAMYARSLESVARISNHSLLFATSISGDGKMKLLNRIGYLLGIAPANTTGNWWTLGVVAAILPVAAFVAFSYSAAAKPPAETAVNKLRGDKTVDAIVTTKIQAKTVTLVEEFVGQINANRHIEVRASAKGYLDEFSVTEGQRVKEGDTLFKVRPVLYQAMLDAEAADASVAQLEYNYTKKLFEDKVVSKDEVALREAKLAKATAKVKIATAELDYTIVKAAFDGIVDRVQRQKGSLVLEGEVVTNLSENRIVRVYFDVSESRYLEYMTDEQPQDELQVQLALANGTTFDQPGKINAIEADFNNATGTIRFRADFPNPSGLVRHGQTGIVRMSRPLKNAILVPQKATIEVLNRRFVFIVDKDNTAHLREITLQQELDESYVVKSGVSADDTIVVEGLRHIVDGEKVTSHKQE